MTDQPTQPDSPFGAPLWDALARYVAGESSRGEAQAVRAWLAEDPRRAELLAALERSMNSLAYAPPADLKVEAALRRVTARLDEAQVRPLVPRWWSGMGLRAAAAVALLAGGGLVWRNIQPGDSGRTTTPQVFATLVGQTDSVRLPDGTLAILGPESRLDVPPAYGDGSRAVHLQGEAFFNVVHDSLAPFTVRAGGATVLDLGTAFVVRDDGSDGIQVMVTEGSVLLQGNESGRGTSNPLPAPKPDGGIVLKAGDRGVVGRDGQPVAERSAVTPDDLAWTSGRLLFENATLARVRTDLRRWYGVELQVADSTMAGRHLTASFAGEPLGQVLEVLGLALGARIERRGDTVMVLAK